jgi:hypothetical protein
MVFVKLWLSIITIVLTIAAIVCTDSLELIVKSVKPIVVKTLHVLMEAIVLTVSAFVSMVGIIFLKISLKFNLINFILLIKFKGFTGHLCQLRESLCDSQPCLNGGTCLTNDTSANFSCICPTGFEGISHLKIYISYKILIRFV